MKKILIITLIFLVCQISFGQQRQLEKPIYNCNNWEKKYTSLKNCEDIYKRELNEYNQEIKRLNNIYTKRYNNLLDAEQNQELLFTPNVKNAVSIVQSINNLEEFKRQRETYNNILENIMSIRTKSESDWAHGHEAAGRIGKTTSYVDDLFNKLTQRQEMASNIRGKLSNTPFKGTSNDNDVINNTNRNQGYNNYQNSKSQNSNTSNNNTSYYKNNSNLNSNENVYARQIRERLEQQAKVNRQNKINRENRIRKQEELGRDIGNTIVGVANIIHNNKKKKDAIYESARDQQLAEYELVKDGLGYTDSNGLKQGPWTYYNNHMKITEQGLYQNDRKEGWWINNTWSTGKGSNGKPWANLSIRKQIIIEKDKKKVKERTFKKSKRRGSKANFYKNGQIIETSEIINLFIYSKAITFFGSGEIEASGKIIITKEHDTIKLGKWRYKKPEMEFWASEGSYISGGKFGDWIYRFPNKESIIEGNHWVGFYIPSNHLIQETVFHVGDNMLKDRYLFQTVGPSGMYFFHKDKKQPNLDNVIFKDIYKPYEESVITFSKSKISRNDSNHTPISEGTNILRKAPTKAKNFLIGINSNDNIISMGDKLLNNIKEQESSKKNTDHNFKGANSEKITIESIVNNLLNKTWKLNHMYMDGHGDFDVRGEKFDLEFKIDNTGFITYFKETQSNKYEFNWVFDPVRNVISYSVLNKGLNTTKLNYIISEISENKIEMYMEPTKELKFIFYVGEK